MKDIGIDLGTKNIVVYLKNKGIIINEPSIIALDNNDKVIAIGKDAYEMLGRTPDNVKVFLPLKDGVIADIEKTELMLNSFLKKALGKTLFPRYRIVICCPSNITEVEKNAIKEIAEKTKAKKVYVEEEAKVAAIGAGLDISKPNGSMVVDIGGGTTDIAILSLGSVVTSSSIKIAGNKFDEEITNYIKDKYKLLIGENTSEEIKIKIGTVAKNRKKQELEINGRNLESGLPETITVYSYEIEEALRDSVKKIIREVKKVLEKTPPELSADIVKKGIILTGGGSLIDGLPEVFKDNLKVPVYLSDNPLENVATGAGLLLENIELLEY